MILILSVLIFILMAGLVSCCCYIGTIKQDQKRRDEEVEFEVINEAREERNNEHDYAEIEEFQSLESGLDDLVKFQTLKPPLPPRPGSAPVSRRNPSVQEGVTSPYAVTDLTNQRVERVRYENLAWAQRHLRFKRPVMGSAALRIQLRDNPEDPGGDQNKHFRFL